MAPDEQTDTYIASVCLIGHGAATCRYLMMDSSGWRCGKNTELRAELDSRVADGRMKAQGDNCGGVDK